MPLFEYKCRECGERFEKLVGMNPLPGSIVCPRCESTEVAKQYSTFATMAASTRNGGAACSPATGFG